MFKNSFRYTLLKQATEALKANEITKEQYRAIRIACWRPNLLREIENRVIEDARASGLYADLLAAGVTDIDWDALAEFIREILEMILEFILSLMLKEKENG